MRKRIKVFAGLLTILIVLVFLRTVPTVQAADEAVLLLSGYSISDSKGETTQLVRGESVTLTLQLTNYSQEINVENVYLQLMTSKGLLPKFGTTGQYFIGTIPAGETVPFEVEYTVDASYEYDTVEFVVDVFSDARSQTAYLSIPCGSDSPFLILESSIPSSVGKGEQLEASVTFKILGEDNVSNVSVIVTSNGVPLSSNFIGILTAGATKTQKTSVSFTEAGQVPVEIYLQYSDITGQKKAFLVDSSNVTVEEGHSSNSQGGWGDLSVQDNAGINKLALLAIAGITILLISFVVIYILSKRRR